jgi:hypothetical protein
MPEPDLARLGSGHIRLEPDTVQFTPTRVQAWRGMRAVSFPYAEVASLVMTEPKRLGRGRMIVRLGNGDSPAMSFGYGRLPAMRRTYRDLWQRVRAARSEDPGPAD